MCMQDLAISARVQWRTVQLKESGYAGWLVLPASPMRVSFAGWNSSNDTHVVLRLSPSGLSPIVNAQYDNIGGTAIVYCMFGVFDQPGVFSTDLFVEASLLDIETWESVMDSDLSKAVQGINLSISTNGG